MLRFDSISNHYVSRCWLRIGLAALALMFLASCRDEDPAEVSTDETLDQGAYLYDRNCLVCHGGETGGQITDVPPPHNAEGHTWHHGDCEIIQMILEGNDEFRQGMLQQQSVPPEDSVMPAFGDRLTEDEALAILAYITTWWTEEQREFQTRATEQLC